MNDTSQKADDRSPAPSLGPHKAKRSKMTPEEQLAAFQKAARDIGTDNDPERFKERVRKVGSAKPADSTIKARPK